MVCLVLACHGLLLLYSVLLTLTCNHSRAVSANSPLIEKALRGQFVIPDFESFREKIDQLYQECLPITDGEVSATVKLMDTIECQTNTQYSI